MTPGTTAVRAGAQIRTDRRAGPRVVLPSPLAGEVPGEGGPAVRTGVAGEGP
jgi:hypothetical protein